MYHTKCIIQNVSYKMYHTKCIIQNVISWQVIEFINDRPIVFRRLVIEHGLRNINYLTGPGGAY
jgi:hypothetical protein